MKTAMALLLLVLTTTSCVRTDSVDPARWSGTALVEGVELPDMTLPDMFGEPYALRDALDDSIPPAVTMIFVGYTYCPDICPVHLANLGTVLRDLPIEKSRQVRTLFVTADPERDTPERLQEWLPALHTSFVGLRGTREEINGLEDALGIPRSVVDPAESPEDYFVGHAGQVLAFDGEGRARAAYPWGIRQRDWQRDLPRLIRGEWPPVEPQDQQER